MLDFLTRGPLMDEADGDLGGGGGGDLGGGEVAVVDTGAVTAPDTGGDAGAVTAPDAGLDTQADTSLQIYDDRGQISKAFTKHLEPVDPKIRGLVLRGLGVKSAVEKEVGSKDWRGGIRTLKAENKVLKDTLLELGDNPDLDTSITLIRETLEETLELDGLLASGDPKALAFITGTEAGKVGFQRLMPHAMALWEQMNPAAHHAYLASRFVGDMQGYQKLKDKEGRDLKPFRPIWELEQLARWTSPELADKSPNPAVQILANINAWIEKWIGMELAAPEPPKLPEKPAVDPALSQREQDLNAREAKAKANEWKSNADRDKNEIYTGAVRALVGTKQTTDAFKDALQALMLVNLPIAMKNDRRWGTLGQYWNSGDENGYRATIKAMHAEHIPKLVKKHGLPLLGGKAPAVASVPAKTTGPAATGFTKVNERPDRNTFDLDRHRREDPQGKMFENHQYFIKGQKQPVQWVRK